MKLNDEFVNGIDGCTYKVTRTISGNSYEIVLVRNQQQTLEHMLSKAQAANFSTEKQRIATASKWFKTLLKNNKDKK